MAKRGEKGRFTKGFGWEFWLDKVMQTILVLVALYALYQTNLSIGESASSVELARKALELQIQESLEERIRDSIKGVQDSIKTARSIELTERQILALRQQANALEKGVRNTEVSQEPYLDIEHFGFHYGVGTDTIVGFFHIVNRGIRPTIVRSYTSYIFDENFNFIDSLETNIRTTLVNDKIVRQPFPLTVGGVKMEKYTLDQLLPLKTTYVCFVFHYSDYMVGKEVCTHKNPILFKWIKKHQNELVFSILDNHRFLPFELCKKDEEVKLIESLNKLTK